MSEIKIIDFEEIENLPRNKLEPIYYGDSIIIRLKPCPICGCEKSFYEWNWTNLSKKLCRMFKL